MRALYRDTTRRINSHSRFLSIGLAISCATIARADDATQVTITRHGYGPVALAYSKTHALVADAHCHIIAVSKTKVAVVNPLTRRYQMFDSKDFHEVQKKLAGDYSYVNWNLLKRSGPAEKISGYTAHHGSVEGTLPDTGMKYRIEVWWTDDVKVDPLIRDVFCTMAFCYPPTGIPLKTKVYCSALRGMRPPIILAVLRKEKTTIEERNLRVPAGFLKSDFIYDYFEDKDAFETLFQTHEKELRPQPR